MSSLLDRPRILFADLVRACKTDRRSLKSLFARHGVTIDAPGTKQMGVYTVELRDKMGVFCDSLEDVEARRARRGDAAPPDEAMRSALAESPCFCLLCSARREPSPAP